MQYLGHKDNKTIIDIIEKSIERNFGGIDYEIDIDLNMEFEDIDYKIKELKKIFGDLIANGRKIVSSVFLFKKIYNKISKEKDIQYQISEDNCKKCDLNNCIDNYITDMNNPRYLLIGMNPSLYPLIYQQIKNKASGSLIELYDGSPFEEDNNKEYIFRIINEIQDDANKDKLIILQNLNQIHPFLYDLYSKNYIIKDCQNYARIFFNVFNEQLTPINDSFKIIIFADERFMNYADVPFLNKFEKIKINFDNLLNEQQLKIANEVINEIDLKNIINKYKKSIKYNLKNLLINCGKQEIMGLVYNLYMNMEANNIKDENEIKIKVYEKISKILPQDIISILPSNNIIKQKYNDKKYCNLNQCIMDADNLTYRISIIYTFSEISDKINGCDGEYSFKISDIKNENQLKLKIEELKKKYDNSKQKNNKNIHILIHFEQINSNKIQYISNFINKNYKEKDDIRFIFIIHLKRNIRSNDLESGDDSEEEESSISESEDFLSEKIYAIPDIDKDINQLFIDNLNGMEINLNNVLDKNIK